MKVLVNVGSGINLEVEAADDKGLFKAIADAQGHEFFKDKSCQACNSTDIKFQVRTVEDNDFYEIVCKKCWAKLSFGHSKTGQKMYAKRLKTDNKGKAVKDGEKSVPLPHKGWCKYNKETGENE